MILNANVNSRMDQLEEFLFRPAERLGHKCSNPDVETAEVVRRTHARFRGSHKSTFIHSTHTIAPQCLTFAAFFLLFGRDGSPAEIDKVHRMIA
jgi:hypothetical protein